MNFKDLNKTFSNKFVANTENYRFEKIGNVLFKNLRLDAVFINNKSKYGLQPVLCCALGNDTFKVSIPNRYLDTIECILETEELIEKINKKEAYVYISDIFIEKYKKTSYDVIFIDKVNLTENEIF